MARKPNLTDKFMAEKINYGGEIRTRASVAREMKKEGFPVRAIDRFAYGTPTIEEDRKKAAARKRAARLFRSILGSVLETTISRQSRNAKREVSVSMSGLILARRDAG